MSLNSQYHTPKKVVCRYGLTEKQSDLLGWLHRWFEARDVAPSYNDIMKGMGLSSRSHVFRLVHALRERGYVTFQDKRGRSLCLVAPEDQRRDAELAEARRALLTLTKAADAAVAYLPEAAPARKRLSVARRQCGLAIDRARAAVPFAGPPARVPLPRQDAAKRRSAGTEDAA